MPQQTTITMPPLGESVAEGTIVRWLKNVGDHVGLDEPLVEVLTDKINAEVPSAAGGTLAQILAKEGDVVKVGAPMCVISEDDASAAPQATQPVTKEKSPAEPQKASPPPAQMKEDTGLYPADASKAILLEPAGGRAPSGGNGRDTERRLRERSSPLVRRILEENGLPLSIIDQIQGSGAEGRVTKDDVLVMIASRAKEPSAQSAPSAAPAQPAPSVAPPGDTDAEVTPLAGIRKVIAERLSYSEHVAPHVTTFAEVDVTELVALRARSKQWAQEEEGVNLTYLPFVIKALCGGLKAFGSLNSSLIDGQLYRHRRIHVAVAVSLDQAGLILPVIKDADGLSVIELAKRIQDVAARARDNKLSPDEVRGSTFTVSNPGAFGGWLSTPIINQPNAAILNTGKILKMPWVMPDDTIVPRSIMFLSLSYDHRIVDGETSVRFLQYVKKSLEQVESTLLR